MLCSRWTKLGGAVSAARGSKENQDRQPGCSRQVIFKQSQLFSKRGDDSLNQTPLTVLEPSSCRGKQERSQKMAEGNPATIFYFILFALFSSYKPPLFFCKKKPWYCYNVLRESLNLLISHISVNCIKINSDGWFDKYTCDLQNH